MSPERLVNAYVSLGLSLSFFAVVAMLVNADKAAAVLAGAGLGLNVAAMVVAFGSRWKP